MGWIKKVPPPHVCSLPWIAPSGVGKGSVWGCTCGKQYEMTGVTSDFFGVHPRWEELIP